MSRRVYLGAVIIVVAVAAVSGAAHLPHVGKKNEISSLLLKQAHRPGIKLNEHDMSKNEDSLKKVFGENTKNSVKSDVLARRESKIAKILSGINKGGQHYRDQTIRELISKNLIKSVCGYGDFTCDNGNCIPSTWECDSWDDCNDGSDEANCGCKSYEFACDSGACIPEYWECDGLVDCYDGSDEEYCGCDSDEFTCANGECIPEAWECDNWDDCNDGSDELSCSACEDGKFECYDGTCIYDSWQCDGEDDCADGSDEVGCATPSICLDTQFQCGDDTCIYGSWQCDGEDDCADASDEFGCAQPTTPIPPSTDEAGCPSGELPCNDGVCIPTTWLCDGFVDCSDEDDEEDCGVGTCRADEFTCADGSCFPGAFECDGYPDCSDGSDEDNCDGGTGWSEWSDWGNCNVDCGTGEHSRSRHCLNADDDGCTGESTEYKLCHLQRCYPEATTGCGTRKVQPQPRIVGGEDALPKEWPWQVMLFYIPGDDVYCGGTLVGPRHVVSAAHCFEGEAADKETWVVILGKYWTDRDTTTGDEAPMEFAIKSITVHENYNQDIELDNDIALLELDGEAPVTDYINYACLDDEGRVHLNESSYCFVTGWGSLSGDYLVSDEVLQEALVPLMSHDVCRATLAPHEISDNMMCAGYLAGGIDSCQGDSGGPLVCMHGSSSEDPGRWYLVGVVSWGIGCAEVNSPGIYTVVRNYYDWLRNASNGVVPPGV